MTVRILLILREKRRSYLSIRACSRGLRPAFNSLENEARAKARDYIPESTCGGPTVAHCQCVASVVGSFPFLGIAHRMGAMLRTILFALLFVQAQTNQTSSGVIRGQILIPSVRASERIPVTIQRSDGPIVARIFSDTLGNFEVRNLPGGTYEILVNVEGYEEVRQQVAIGGGLFGAATVNIPLQEKDKFVVIKPNDGGA